MWTYDKNPGWNKSPDQKFIFVGLGLYKHNGIGQKFINKSSPLSSEFK